MTHNIYDPVVEDAPDEKRQFIQEQFGRHLIEHRNRMAERVRKWIEADAEFPIPIYDRLIERIRILDAQTRSDVASISLLMADQIVTAVLMAFSKGEEMRIGDRVANYAVVAQIRQPGSDEVVEEVDVNRGTPVIAIWDTYKKWLSRFSTSELRP